MSRTLSVWLHDNASCIDAMPLSRRPFQLIFISLRQVFIFNPSAKIRAPSTRMLFQLMFRVTRTVFRFMTDPSNDAPLSPRSLYDKLKYVNRASNLIELQKTTKFFPCKLHLLRFNSFRVLFCSSISPRSSVPPLPIWLPNRSTLTIWTFLFSIFAIDTIPLSLMPLSWSCKFITFEHFSKAVQTALVPGFPRP